MLKILILFAHPALQKSRINKILIEGIDQLDDVTFHDLYQSYPEFDIDVEHEQELLSEHDVVVLHHPLFWYSTPAILKEWQDLVLEHGWAYGRAGNALKGKSIFNVITTGGSQQAYTAEGYNRTSILQLLQPIQKTFKLCKMNYLPPFVVHGTHSITHQQIHQEQKRYHQLLTSIRDEKVDVNAASDLSYLNDYVS